jgi:3-oxoacyl-(acyl-carrier-protein) synthase
MHARLRRASPIAQYAVGAAMEALKDALLEPLMPEHRLGVIVCAMSGCVNYSRRFYDEALKDPATASPLVFPETVFNAPSSHLASLLGATGMNYTLVGDPGTFVQALALAAKWLLAGQVDNCLVIGAEELDWLTTEACQMFERQAVVCDGAGALVLSRQPGNSTARLAGVTDPSMLNGFRSRKDAAINVRQQVRDQNWQGLLCDGLQGMEAYDRPEEAAWKDWTGPRFSPKKFLGEGLMAAAAWQCVLAADAVRSKLEKSAIVNVLGTNQQAIAACFEA